MSNDITTMTDAEFDAMEETYEMVQEAQCGCYNYDETAEREWIAEQQYLQEAEWEKEQYLLSLDLADLALYNLIDHAEDLMREEFAERRRAQAALTPPMPTQAMIDQAKQEEEEEEELDIPF